MEPTPCFIATGAHTGPALLLCHLQKHGCLHNLPWLYALLHTAPAQLTCYEHPLNGNAVLYVRAYWPWPCMERQTLCRRPRGPRPGSRGAPPRQGSAETGGRSKFAQKLCGLFGLTPAAIHAGILLRPGESMWDTVTWISSVGSVVIGQAGQLVWRLDPMPSRVSPVQLTAGRALGPAIASMAARQRSMLPAAAASSTHSFIWA